MKRRLISGNLYNTVPKLVKLVSPLGIQQNYIIEKKLMKGEIYAFRI